MSKVNSEFARQYKSIVEAGWKLKPKVWTPVTGEAVSADDPPLLIASPAGAINLLLPISNAANQGLMFLIVNNSANAITLQSSGGAGFTTAIVLAATRPRWSSVLVTRLRPSDGRRLVLLRQRKGGLDATEASLGGDASSRWLDQNTFSARFGQSDEARHCYRVGGYVATGLGVAPQVRGHRNCVGDVELSHREGR
jgi:hypothetical protein